MKVRVTAPASVWLVFSLASFPTCHLVRNGEVGAVWPQDNKSAEHTGEACMVVNVAMAKT